MYTRSGKLAVNRLVTEQIRGVSIYFTGDNVDEIDRWIEGQCQEDVGR